MLKEGMRRAACEGSAAFLQGACLQGHAVHNRCVRWAQLVSHLVLNLALGGSRQHLSASRYGRWGNEGILQTARKLYVSYCQKLHAEWLSGHPLAIHRCGHDPNT